jgi:serine-type D-Ala-D-Ala carboxypeptidase/endopeptidase (penicillin-binding protein 4)
MKYFLLFLFSTTLFACKLTGQITQKQINVFLNDTAVRSGHAGISIYEPATQKYLYNYNAEKNFTPSSNVKLFTLYAGMKYLGDSLVVAIFLESNDTIYFQPTGDPTFLHKDFQSQIFLDYLLQKKRKLVLVSCINDKFEKYGTGWSWDDNLEDFMPERTRFPTFGNIISFKLENSTLTTIPRGIFKPPYFREAFMQFLFRDSNFKIYRNRDKNEFSVFGSKEKFTGIDIPFIVDEKNFMFPKMYPFFAEKINTNVDSIGFKIDNTFLSKKFHSQPTDSLFRPMMHNSDNFFAEQTILMVSNEKLGYMSDEDIIDTLLKTDFKDLPTKPRWVDGSGLSRYNLFSPKDFVYLLDKMKNEFGMERLKGILTTGGQGTLKGYYENAIGSIYAKTGSMSNNVSLSGYLFTKKNKMLIFSVQINGFSGTGRAGRRAIEKMLQQIRENN